MILCVMTEPATLADNMRRCRLNAKLSQADLAKASGLSLTSIRNIEQGVLTDPKLSTLKRIAAAIGVTVADLVSVEAHEAPAITRVRKPRKRPGDEASSP